MFLQKILIKKQFCGATALPPPLFVPPAPNFQNLGAGTKLFYFILFGSAILILIEIKNDRDITALPGIVLLHHTWPRWPPASQQAAP